MNNLDRMPFFYCTICCHQIWLVLTEFNQSPPWRLSKTWGLLSKSDDINDMASVLHAHHARTLRFLVLLAVVEAVKRLGFYDGHGAIGVFAAGRQQEGKQ